MNSNFDFLFEVDERINELSCALTEIRNFLVAAPEGRVEVSSRAGNFYYRYVGKERCYLSPKIPEEKQTIEKSLNKSHFKKLLPIIEAELKALLLFRENYKPDEKYKIYESLSPGKRALTKKMFYTFEEREAHTRKKRQEGLEQFCRNWSTRMKEYQNPYKTEDVTIETNDGHLVRSKSERAIADELAKHGYEYKYETAFHTNLGVFYPDFRILDKSNGREYIWEHFGMLDNSRYLNKECLAKLDAYAAEGYVLGHNLLATFETIERPLQLSQVHKTIEMIEMNGAK